MLSPFWTTVEPIRLLYLKQTKQEKNRVKKKQKQNRKRFLSTEIQQICTSSSGYAVHKKQLKDDFITSNKCRRYLQPSIKIDGCIFRYFRFVRTVVNTMKKIYCLLSFLTPIIKKNAFVDRFRSSLCYQRPMNNTQHLNFLRVYLQPYNQKRKRNEIYALPA